MRYSIFMAVAALMALAACTSDNDTPEPQQPATDGVVRTPVTITAAYGDDAGTTRTAYTESGSTISATWQEGDQILVVFDGHVNTLAMTDGAGTESATFSGTVLGTPKAASVLSCYVKDVNNPGALTIDGDGDLIYSDAAFLAQDGTLAGAAKCNTHSGSTTYGDGTDLRVNFAVNTSMLKFTVLNPYDVWAYPDVTKDATLTYMSGETALAKASFTVGTVEASTIYMAVPAGQYTGAQTLVYKCGATEVSRTLSSSKADFKYGQTYSKKVDFDDVIRLGDLGNHYTASDGEVLTGSSGYPISIADGATVTFRGIGGQVICLGDATIILADGTTNTVTGDDDAPGIFVPEAKTLTIRGTGSLNASSYSYPTSLYAAAIGSGLESNCGNIVIEGGNITATGGSESTGIGSSYYRSCGNITISGGNVTATGGIYSAGIGSGYNGSCGNITISGGSVTATKGDRAPYSIGKGYGGSCGTITIDGRVYYDGTNFLNNGDMYLEISPLRWPGVPQP